MRGILSSDTIVAINFDIIKFKARFRNRKENITSTNDKLHLGCGNRKINGWLNVDVSNSDYNLDLSSGKLPWEDNVFQYVVSQHLIEHLIEHLKLENELLPLISEIARVMKNGGEIWLSTPDLEKICNSYSKDKARGLIADRKTRYPKFNMDNIPPQHFINKLFHQSGQHKNLFDFEMIVWMLEKNSFVDCKKITEAELLSRLPNFPKRNDDFQSVYVTARIKK